MIHESGSMFLSSPSGWVFSISISISISISRHVTTKRAMGCGQSTPAFYHPDLIVTFTCNPTASCLSQKWYRCKSRGLGAGDAIHCFGLDVCGDPGTTDPGWARNSPLRIELVDLLSDALKAMGGWPKYDTCLGRAFHGQVAPRLVEAINKVCKKFNDAKLFDMGLQCRAITYIYKKDAMSRPVARLLVLVEKKSEYKLGDVGESLEHLAWLEEMQGTWYMGYEAKSLLAWSPPEDWMTRLTPYNESTNHV